MREVIEQYSGVIKAVIKKFTGSYNEDLEQEVYIKTWRNMDKYQETGKFKSWIATVAANVCRDYFRSAVFLQSRQEISADDALPKCAVPAQQEKIISAKDRQKIILSAINSLPTKLRKIIVLYEFEEYTIPQIAKKLNEPEGTIKSRLYTARNTLAEKLKFLQGDY